MRQWSPLPLEAKWFQNVDESVLSRTHAALENAFHNEAGGVSRFPGLEIVATLPDTGRVYLHDWRGDLCAVTSNGRFYVLDRDFNVTDRTKVPISGDGRAVFARTEDELLIAAGRQIVRFAGEETEILSEDAPQATHVSVVDSYVLANERHSGRFFHSEAGEYRSWNPLDVFAADSRSDPVSGLLVTEFREILACGSESIEQFERLSTAETPFFRRWAIGEGLYQPYTLLDSDRGTWVVNRHRELVRVSGQTGEPRSDDLARSLEAIPQIDWREAWIGGYPNEPLHVLGQRFILLQLPNALTPYDTRGLTLLYDYRQNRWSSLYDWDSATAKPTRWPGWSYWPLDGYTYVGGEGVIYRLRDGVHTNNSRTQRMYLRTASYHNLGEARIDALRVRARRGEGSNMSSASLMLRATRDRRGATRWMRKSLGKAGDREAYIEYGALGIAHDWQFELLVTDDAPVDITNIDVQLDVVGH